MLPEQRARVKIDRQLKDVGWDIVSRDEYVPGSTCAVTEALMQGNTESDYLFFVDDKAIAVLEAKRGENPLGDDVRAQAEGYEVTCSTARMEVCALAKAQQFLHRYRQETGRANGLR